MYLFRLKFNIIKLCTEYLSVLSHSLLLTVCPCFCTKHYFGSGSGWIRIISKTRIWQFQNKQRKITLNENHNTFLNPDPHFLKIKSESVFHHNIGIGSQSIFLLGVQKVWYNFHIINLKKLARLFGHTVFTETMSTLTAWSEAELVSSFWRASSFDPHLRCTWTDVQGPCEVQSGLGDWFFLTP